jgi:F-type H+-transporting ATPase subunit b
MTQNNNITLTEAPGSGSKFPPFQSDTFATQLFWFAITFVLLYVIAGRFGLPRIKSILEKRQRRIEDALRQAEDLKKRSEQTMAAYDKALVAARTNAGSVMQQARTNADAVIRKNRETCAYQSDAKLADANRAIAAKKAATLTDLRAMAVEAGKTITERLTGAAPASNLVQDAVDSVLERGANVHAVGR